MKRVLWRDIVARYQAPDPRKSVMQIFTTLVPLGGALFLMHRSLALSYWLTLALSVPTAGLLVRTFIIMHDCGHGSFFRSRRANDLVGFIAGVLTLTPYLQWRRDHAIHHATSGNLENRGHGDITTLTVREYLQASRWKRLRYRIYRNPLVMFGLGPLYLMFMQRVRWENSSEAKRERFSVWATNLALAALVTGCSFLIGIKALLLIYVPAFMFSGAAGIWLFYVQHQFDDTYWEGRESWDYADAAMRGSSYFKLPRVLQWFTGSIGLHHVHHLNPGIPNYLLQRCHDENPVFHGVTVLTLWQSLKTLRLKLWDEHSRRMVGYRHLKQARQRARASNTPQTAS